MGIFRRRGAPPTEARSIEGDLTSAIWAQRRGGGSAGQYVSADTAMQLMAVWRCRTLLTDIVSGLPIDQYRKPVGGGDRVPMDLSPWVASPSAIVEPEDFRAQLMMSMLECGNAYALVHKWDAAGRYPLKTETIDPRDVTVSRPKGALQPPAYKVGNEPIDSERMIHLRAFGPRPGSVMGLNPLEYARNTIGLGLAVRAYGAGWYEGGGHPTSVLVNANPIDKAQAEQAKARWKEATSSDHVAVLGHGWDYRQAQVAPDDALFLAATNATSVDICGFYGVPPEMLGFSAGGGSLTYANREQRALDFLTWSVQWWVGRIEKAFSRHLPPGEYVKLNVDALLRSDSWTRWQIHDKAVRIGAHSINDVRHIEDEPAIANGDSYLWPPYAFGQVGPNGVIDPQGSTA
ncbi:MAG: phage-related portal protein [Actinomycetota bacterium]|jgi:HK97 family phage portal protein